MQITIASAVNFSIDSITTHLLPFCETEYDLGFNLKIYIQIFCFNPLVPDAHDSERQEKPLSLQIQRLEVDLKLNCRFLFCAPWELMG